MRKSLGSLGAVVAIIGFGGKIAGEMYLDENPVRGAAEKVAAEFGSSADGMAGAAVFMSDYGLIIGLLGLALAALGLVLARR